MKVCLIHNEYGKPSGEETVLNSIQQILEGHDHHVCRFTRSSSEIPSILLGNGRAFFDGIYSYSSRNAMKAFLDENKPKIGHVHNVFPLLSPSVLSVCRTKGIPVVMTVHNYRLVCPNGLFMSRGEICERCSGGKEYWCVLRNCGESISKSIGYAVRNWVARKKRFFLDSVTLYATLTEFQRERLITEGFPPDRIMVIPNMVSSNHLDTAPLNGDYVTYVGRVSPEKGIPVLMDAARKDHKIPFIVAGDYDRMPHLMNEAPHNFQFLGHAEIEELKKIYQSTLIFTFSNTCYEGFPMAIAEAMLYGKPVICSRIGGLPEIVEYGVTGFLFEPGNADELAEKIAYLWDRPDLCRKMGEAGREKALREYSPERYYQRLMVAYEKAIELGPGGGGDAGKGGG